jgi:RNA polymerase sigma-70 factor (ECF subfamily)
MLDPLAALLTGTASGDQTAFAALYDATCSRVYGLALRYVDTFAEADRMTKHIYLQIWRDAGGYSLEQGPALCWLMVLANNRMAACKVNAPAVGGSTSSR